MMPNQIEIEIPLLSTLKKLGGKAKPKDVYGELTKAFPALTASDLAEQLQSGGNRWTNRIQWVRQALVARGELSNQSHGVWEITPMGLSRLKAHHETLTTLRDSRTKEKSELEKRSFLTASIWKKFRRITRCHSRIMYCRSCMI